MWLLTDFWFHLCNSTHSRFNLTDPIPPADFRDILKGSLIGREVSIPSPYELNNIESLYWDTDNLSKFIPQNHINSNFLLHFNIQNFPSKFDALFTFINRFYNEGNKSCIPSIIALSETWLNKYNESCFPIDNYQPLVVLSKRPVISIFF